jgi:hypothetical protein
MSSSDPLFDLIKSLSPAEKRHFRLIATDSDSGVMLKIYDAIDKMDVFDEEVLKKKLKDPGLLKNLSSNKLKLRERLADIVTEFNYQSSIIGQIKFNIRKAEVLFERKLTGIAHDVLLKARKSAVLYDLPLLQAEINSIESRFMQGNNNIQKQNNLDNMKQLSAMQNMYEYYDAVIDYVQVIRDFGLNSMEFNKHIQKMGTTDLFNNEDYPQTFLAKDQFYSIRAQLARNNRTQDDFYKWTQKIIDLWDDNPQMKELYPVRYVHSTHALQLLTQDIWDEPKRPASDFKDACIEQIKDHRTFFKKHKESNLPMEVMEIDLLCSEVLLYAAFDMHKQLAALYDGVKDTLIPKNYKTNNYYLANAKLLFAKQFMLVGDYTRALDCLNDVLNEKGEGYFKDAYYNGSFSNILLHFQLGNDTIIESLLAQLQRWLDKNNIRGEGEKKMIAFLRKYLNADKQERKQMVQQPLSSLLQELQKPEGVYDTEVLGVIENWQKINTETKGTVAVSH